MTLINTGRSSDLFHFLRPSHPHEADSGNRTFKKLIIELTATGIVPDSHWIPFSFRSQIKGLRKTKCGANIDKI